MDWTNCGPAWQALRAAATKSVSLEVRRCVRQLLEKLGRSPPPPRQLQALRAIEVLEYLGTPEARRLLTSLAQGATHARLTQEAKAALERLR
jgi:replication-associated recombination protein RarA